MGRKPKVDPNTGAEIVPISVDLTPATLEQPEAESYEVANLPKEWEAADTLGGFYPSPKFVKPGEAIGGTFVNVRVDVGPHNSRLYEINAHMGKDKKPQMVSVWGSSALDRCFDSAMPPIKPGDNVLIIYMGEKETQRKAHPVKTFRFLVKRAGVAGVESMATSGASAGNGKPPVDITPPKEVGKQPATAGAGK